MWCKAVGCIITLILGLLAALLTAAAQPVAKMPRIGVLVAGFPLVMDIEFVKWAGIVRKVPGCLAQHSFGFASPVRREQGRSKIQPGRRSLGIELHRPL